MQANNNFLKQKGWSPKIDFDEGLKEQLICIENFIKYI